MAIDFGGATIDAKQERGFVVATILDDFNYYFLGQVTTYGAIEFSKTVSLPANALVDVFDITVTAARATLAQANQVAQVRSGPSANSQVAGNGQTVVIDFGTPRTVSTVTVPSAYGIYSISAWNGAQFMSPIFRASTVSSTTSRALLSAEPRTERLQIEVTGSSDAGPLIEGLLLVLPDSPSDLEIRIDGAAPAWTHPGATHPGTSETITDDAWSVNGERTVHLSDALGALTGDPVSNDERSFEVKLISRAPGLLKIDDGARSLRRIRRARFDGRTDTTITFEAEGELLLPLTAPGLPPAATVLEVRLSAEADFGDTRTLPPIGPMPFPTVDLILDQDRAVLVRLPADSGLAALTGVRLPIAAGSEGAEVRVVLWGNSVSGPDAPLSDATSDPVTLSAADEPDWISFAFGQSIPVADDDPPWAAVLVTRGRATLGLAQSTGGVDPLEAQSIRLGPHGGPWGMPPAGLRSGTFASVRGRSRVSGTAPKEAPLAPFSVSISGESVEAVGLDPGPNGLTATISGGSAGEQALRLTAYGPGVITLRDVDIITMD